MDSRVHPDLKTLFSTFPETILDENGLEETRKQMHQMAQNYIQPSDDLVAKSFHSIPGLQGAPAIPIVIYEPVSKHKMMSGVLWIHGGGYIIGGAEINDALCRRFVLETDSLVVSVDYRLAPEHPYPAPLEDCYSALKWFSENATTLGVDSNRIAVAGQSAGGGLTAALSLLARDRKGPKIAFQMPLYPMIDDRNITPSSYEITDARVWNRESNIFGWQMYLGKDGNNDISQYAAPARATDLSGLPPTYTCVGELDLFRDETIDYVTRLLRAGVPTEFHIYPGSYHGFEAFMSQAPIGQRAESQYVEALKYALNK
ncbi:alpha/beta hydrolase [Paenibacillus sp. PsM32]|uniref:alpha/beta hydrolase n=1 Tax=Paenibacillus sp. PsM32 TaxID=3030536 RepID=UPI00263AB74B|nr:alpha/beta hydrolase [Paenibacillus sp. PsM32]MDN4618413.1 alpha/beta hydrolase [Paenibacillus sp. PsM32]